jgi:hypothetical protein
MVRRPRRLEGGGVDLGEPKLGNVTEPPSGSHPAGDAPEVPTVGTEGVGGSRTRCELVKEGIDQLADVGTGRPAPAGGNRTPSRLSHFPILAAKRRPYVDLGALTEPT